MYAHVTRLYNNGKELPTRKLLTVSGDLDVSSYIDSALKRLTLGAVLHHDVGCYIPTLYDVQLTNISAKGLRLRGIEVNAGRETSQEWWVRFTLD